MKQYIYLAAIAVLAALLAYQCEEKGKIIRRSQTNVGALIDSVRIFRNKLGGQTASVKTLQMTETELRDVVLNKDIQLEMLSREFTRLKSTISMKTNLLIDTIAVRFESPLTGSLDSASMCNRSGSIDRQWYSFNYKITKDSLVLATFGTPTEAAIVTGIKRKWLLGRQTLTTDVTHSNPYITVTSLQAAEVHVPDPWYRKWYVWLAAGCAAGLMLK